MLGVGEPEYVPIRSVHARKAQQDSDAVDERGQRTRQRAGIGAAREPAGADACASRRRPATAARNLISVDPSAAAQAPW